MRKLQLILAIVALGATACAADVTSSETGLVAAVDEGAVTGQLLYMHDVSAMPLTAEDLTELGIDESDALPVRVEILDGVAVAWFAPEGEALYGQENIVALWEVLDRAEPQDVTPIYNETHPNDPSPTVVPHRVTGTYHPEAEIGVEQDVGTLPMNPVGEAIIDWYNKVGSPDELQYLQLLQTQHTGC